MPLELVYEDDVTPDPAGAVARVLDARRRRLCPRLGARRGMVRQSDELNDEWYAAYHRDAAVRRSR